MVVVVVVVVLVMGVVVGYWWWCSGGDGVGDRLWEGESYNSWSNANRGDDGVTIVWPQQTVRLSCWSSQRMVISLQPTHKRFNSAYL